MKQLIGLAVILLLVCLWGAAQPVHADLYTLYVQPSLGTDIYTKPPSMGGVVVGHLPQGYAVTIYNVVGIEPNAWAKVDTFGYWVRYNQLTDFKWEPE